MEGEVYMRRAIGLAKENIENGGGPFAAVIVKNGEIVAEGANRVTADNDPTAHAEVRAIRAACASLGTFSLEGCDIYTSCEPCPMCFGAIYWAHLDHIYYGCDQNDAAAAGFDDSFIYRELELEPRYRRIPSQPLLSTESQEIFRKWTLKTDKTEY